MQERYWRGFLRIFCILSFLFVFPEIVLAAQGDETPRWLSVLASWTPFLLLLVFWIWMMKRSGIGATRQREHMERVEGLLERIARAVEKDTEPRD